MVEGVPIAFLVVPLPLNNYYDVLMVCLIHQSSFPRIFIFCEDIIRRL